MRSNKDSNVLFFPIQQQIPVAVGWRVFSDYLMAKMFYVSIALGTNELLSCIVRTECEREAEPLNSRRSLVHFSLLPITRFARRNSHSRQQNKYATSNDDQHLSC